RRFPAEAKRDYWVAQLIIAAAQRLWCRRGGDHLSSSRLGAGPPEPAATSSARALPRLPAQVAGPGCRPRLPAQVAGCAAPVAWVATSKLVPQRCGGDPARWASSSAWVIAILAPKAGEAGQIAPRVVRANAGMSLVFYVATALAARRLGKRNCLKRNRR